MGKLLERDWQFLREGAEELERYILSPELYWPLTGVTGGGGQGGALQFTIGNLELSQARLAGVSWPAGEQAELDELNNKIETVHKSWKANWAKKAAQEYPARLKLWQNYLLDAIGEQGHRGSGYPFEVRLRAILHLLSEDLQSPLDVEQAALANLDSRLRAVTHAGPFVWEPDVQPGFPQQVYWYLYLEFNQ